MTQSPVREQLRASIEEVAESIDLAVVPRPVPSDDGSVDPRPQPRRSRVLVGVLVVVVLTIVGLATLSHLNDNPGRDQTDPRLADPGVHPRSSSARSNGKVTTLQTLVRSADAVADVTVSAVSTSESNVGPGEVETQRVATLQVNASIAGARLPATIRLLVSARVAGPTTSDESGVDTMEVGDRLLVALVAQPGGIYELNGSVASFPLGDPAASKAVAAERSASADPVRQQIGVATSGLSDGALITLVRSVR